MGYDSKYGEVVLGDKLVPADEPLFVLRGQDRLAANTVYDYAKKYLEATGDQRGHDRIMAQARRMEIYPVKKLPD